MVSDNNSTMKYELSLLKSIESFDKNLKILVSLSQKFQSNPNKALSKTRRSLYLELRKNGEEIQKSLSMMGKYFNTKE